MNDEIQMVLDMVSQKTITAEEGIALIDRLRKEQSAEGGASSVTPAVPSLGKRKLYVDVFDASSSRRKTHVTIPANMLRAGFNIAKAFGGKHGEHSKELEDLDIDQILEIAASAPEGERTVIVDVEQDDGSHVLVYIE